MIKLKEFFRNEKLVGSTFILSALLLMSLVAIFRKTTNTNEATASVTITKIKCLIVLELIISLQLLFKNLVIIDSVTLHPDFYHQR